MMWWLIRFILTLVFAAYLMYQSVQEPDNKPNAPVDKKLPLEVPEQKHYIRVAGDAR